MNREDAAPSQKDGNDDAARHLARLLPAPVTEDLSPEQFRRQKEILMNRIDADQATDPRRDSPAAAAPRPARRLLRPALLVPVSALALAGILAGGVALGTGDDHGTAAAASSAPAARGGNGLLHHLSTVALASDAPVVRDDQFVYTRSKVQAADITSGKAVLTPLHEEEVWSAQDPRPLKKLGMSRAEGEDNVINAPLGDDNGTPAGWTRPTYKWLATLSTDPDELLAYLYAHVTKDPDQETDQIVFEQIGSWLGGLMPPKTAAALYQAAAKIPGVKEVPNAKDAIGRSGLGIVREDTRYGDRSEWVFDKDNYSFLGSRDYLTKDTPWGKSGTLLSSSAEIEHGIVDKIGQAPEATRESPRKRQAS
ncbi:CU044_5270 family protein [Streptomyces sp. NBC_00144]|uniref:CU044_5270 family protein n=1 Tax=Streptomyces sp. NBC_00144 TaxID=2975665 RepID=UPI0032525817